MRAKPFETARRGLQDCRWVEEESAGNRQGDGIRVDAGFQQQPHRGDRVEGTALCHFLPPPCSKVAVPTRWCLASALGCAPSKSESSADTGQATAVPLALLNLARRRKGETHIIKIKLGRVYLCHPVRGTPDASGSDRLVDAARRGGCYAQKCDVVFRCSDSIRRVVARIC